MRRILLGAFAALTTLHAAGAEARTLIRDAEIEATLEMMSRPIFEAAGIPPDSIEILILQDSTLNAFVFGGRNMVFHTGLLSRLETPEELMGVMAHETGHIVGGHLTRKQVLADNLRGPMALGVALSILAGAAAGSPDLAVGGALGAQSAAQRTFLAYSRSEESSADQAGATYMESAGVDPAAMLDVLKIFRGQEVFQAGNVDPYALTHPLSSERLGLLEDRAARSKAHGEKASPEIAYWHARMRAKLDAFTDSPERTLARLEETGFPEDEISLIKAAVAYHRLPQPEKALTAVDKLISLRPKDPYYRELKGQILYESARAPEAVEPLREAARLAPKEALIQGALGRALLASGADKEALGILETAAQRGAAEPSLLRDLALAYARAGREPEAALATAERYALVGEPREALRHARRALDQLPVGSPAWLRADDIRAVAERALSDK